MTFLEVQLGGPRQAQVGVLPLGVLPLFQLADGLLSCQELVGQVLDPPGHGLLLLLLHDDGPLEGLFEADLVDLQGVVVVLGLAKLHPKLPDLVHRGVKVVQQHQELFRHVLTLHCLDRLHRGHLQK